MIKFWVAGFPINFFYSEFKKKRENLFEWLNILLLDFVELQSTYWVKMKKDQAFLYRSLWEKFWVWTSVHAPYYISLWSADKDIVERSKWNIIKSFELASWLWSKKVIFHPWYVTWWKSREEWLIQLIGALNSIKSILPLDEWIKIYPEIWWKINQLWSLEDIIYICKNVSYARPCLDLAHLHARTLWWLSSFEDFVKMFQLIESELWNAYLEDIHIHMYPVEFNHTGEKVHKAFSDQSLSGDFYWPDYKPLLEAIKFMNVSATIICEAYNSQEIWARLMKDYYNLIKK